MAIRPPALSVFSRLPTSTAALAATWTRGSKVGPPAHRDLPPGPSAGAKGIS